MVRPLHRSAPPIFGASCEVVDHRVLYECSKATSARMYASLSYEKMHASTNFVGTWANSRVHSPSQA